MSEQRQGISIPSWFIGALVALVLAGLGALVTVGSDKATLTQVKADVESLDVETTRKFERVDKDIAQVAKDSREGDDILRASQKELADEARVERQRIDERLRQHELRTKY